MTCQCESTIAEFEVRNLKSPVFYISLSLNKGERGTKEQWQIAAKAYLKTTSRAKEK